MLRFSLNASVKHLLTWPCRPGFSCEQYPPIIWASQYISTDYGPRSSSCFWSNFSVPSYLVSLIPSIKLKIFRWNLNQSYFLLPIFFLFTVQTAVRSFDCFESIHFNLFVRGCMFHHVEPHFLPFFETHPSFISLHFSWFPSPICGPQNKTGNWDQSVLGLGRIRGSRFFSVSR